MATDSAVDGLSARGIFDEAQQAAARHSRPAQAASAVVDISKHSISINRFSISGVSRIRHGFLSTLLEPMFAAQTVERAVAESREAAGKLQALGIVKGVHIELDQPQNGGEGIDVHFSCLDGSRYAIRTGVNVGDDEGTANVTGQLNNIWGGGESLEANYSRGSKTQAAFQGLLSVPVNADPKRQLRLCASQAAMDSRPYSAHDEIRRTLSTAYRASGFNGTTHELQYLMSWRDICNLGLDASPTLRGEAGHSLKSAIAYTLAHDDRDSHTVPTRGSLVKLSTELAGLLGDVRFAKT
ncbi:hypothetical protein IWW55_000184, partial [Coemansia sp. RSA 2706]